MARPSRERVGEVEAYLPLTETNWYVLALLKEKPAHGYELWKKIEQLATEASPAVGNFYITLRQMQSVNLIDELQKPEIVSKRRRVYEITDLGREVIQADTSRLRKRLIIAKELGL